VVGRAAQFAASGFLRRHCAAEEIGQLPVDILALGDQFLGERDLSSMFMARPRSRPKDHRSEQSK
jgi:hypothetical protein